MIKINLRDYPKFWLDFAYRVSQTVDPNAPISMQSIKPWLKEWYNMNVYVTSSSAVAEVYMLNKDYTAFLLRWS
jgi:hypothetical protein